MIRSAFLRLGMEEEGSWLIWDWARMNVIIIDYNNVGSCCQEAEKKQIGDCFICLVMQYYEGLVPLSVGSF